MSFSIPQGFSIKSPDEINEGVRKFGDIATGYYEPPKNSYFQYPVRTWPDNKITQAPTWCSVDLRDGNQSLLKPMSAMEKLLGFKILVELGYKEIEVGFPASGGPDYDFIRGLIDHDLIPDDVTIQVLCQAKEPLVAKTREALEGAKNVIVHIYNSTSEVQREVVFQHGREENKSMALDGVAMVEKYFGDFPGKLTFQYSPESFTGTEMDYAVDVCNSVIDTWGRQSIIINLPATVENCTPNVYADKIEFMKDSILGHTRGRVEVIISLHTHNDRGTGIAATELGMMAGATRVEGCNLDFGERSGNVNLITLAMNLFSQGIDPRLNLANLGEKLHELSQVTRTPIGERQPYVGRWTHTAFSGSHQDAIRKGFEVQSSQAKWENPYLPINPEHIGLKYQPIIVNSQSGKGGAAFVIEQAGYIIPKAMHSQIGLYIQKLTESRGDALSDDDVVEEFRNRFIVQNGDFSLEGFEYDPKSSMGTYEQFVRFISQKYNVEFQTISEGQQSMGTGESALSCAYVHIQIDGKDYFGIGEDHDTAKSPLRALTSALNIYIGV